MINAVKENLAKGAIAHGCWLNSGSALSAEILAHSGLDWVLIDLEHGAGTEQQLLGQLQSFGKGTATPVVRVERNQAIRVQRILDYGAMGIMFPQIRNTEDARQAIRAMYYPPKGQRGIAHMIRATQYGASTQEYYEFARQGLLGIIQIETAESMQHLDEIASIEGVDVLFAGPSDLSMALGVFRQFETTVFKDAIQAIAAAAHRHGKAAGTLLIDINEYEIYCDLGYQFLAHGSDLSFVRNSAQSLVRRFTDKKN